jgi:hypothetical protein
MYKSTYLNQNRTERVSNYAGFYGYSSLLCVVHATLIDAVLLCPARYAVNLCPDSLKLSLNLYLPSRNLTCRFQLPPQISLCPAILAMVTSTAPHSNHITGEQLTCTCAHCFLVVAGRRTCLHSCGRILNYSTTAAHAYRRQRSQTRTCTLPVLQFRSSVLLKACVKKAPNLSCLSISLHLLIPSRGNGMY